MILNDTPKDLIFHRTSVGRVPYFVTDIGVRSLEYNQTPISRNYFLSPQVINLLKIETEGLIINNQEQEYNWKLLG